MTKQFNLLISKQEESMNLRRFTIIFVLVLLAIILVGCSKTNTRTDDKISIVCTIFPQYDWVRQILGEQADTVDLTLLLNNRIDLHNYQPSIDDVVKITNCDLFIYIGGESDDWVENVLSQSKNPEMIVINLLEELGDKAKIEAIVEGMEEEEHEHDEDGEHEEEEGEYDEHIWLSLKNAQILCSVIADALIELNIGTADDIKNNLNSYLEQLSKLDAQYQAITKTAKVKTLLFGDRFPFRYLVDDYGLSYYAAFPGCSAETEASFKTIIFLAQKMDELKLKNIMVTESADKQIAQTIRDNTKAKNQQILVLNAMQSITTSDVEQGMTYISIMSNNLDILKLAMSM
jgi:zinc transport system substrate-binding protein